MNRLRRARDRIRNPFVMDEAEVSSDEEGDAAVSLVTLLDDDQDEIPTKEDLDFVNDDAEDSDYEESPDPPGVTKCPPPAPPDPPGRVALPPQAAGKPLRRYPTPPPLPPDTPPSSPGAKRARVTSTDGDDCAQDVVAGPPSPSHDKRPYFRLHSKQFCLTFPRCDMSREECMRRILSNEDRDRTSGTNMIESAVVAQEQHQDGGNHLHIYLEYKKEKNFRDPSCFDWITGQHGNYDTVRRGKGGRLAWLRYISKADKNPACYNIDVEALLSKRKGSGQFQQVVQHLTDGQPLENVDPSLLATVAKDLKKFQDFSSWYNAAKRKPADWPGSLYLKGPVDLREAHFGFFEVIKWLNANVNATRRRKQLQLYLHAPPNYGKTLLVDWLAKYQRIYRVCLDEDFYDGYNDASYDMMVFDEWKGQRKLQHMNALLEGQEMRLRVKGAQVVKTKNLPIIILSNYLPGEAYSKIPKERLSSFLTRILVVTLEMPLDTSLIHFMNDDGVGSDDDNSQIVDCD